MCEENGQKTYDIVCKQCGDHFTANAANAAYCPKCKISRKKMLDHEAWVRRKKRTSGSYSAKERRQTIARRLEPEHAKELGIDILYYHMWKDSNTTAYKKWMMAHMPPELRPVKRKRRTNSEISNQKTEE